MASIEDKILADSDYNVTFHRSQGKVQCSIWWNLLSYNNLKEDFVYCCPLEVTNALCCPYWILGFKKYKSSVYLSLKCSISNREVSFTIIAEGVTSPFIISDGKEDPRGVYSTVVACSAIHHFTELAKSNFVIMCRAVLDEQDLDFPNYPNPLCSCGKLSEDLEAIFASKKYADIKLIKGKTEFPAHKCFLSARSPPLRRTFESETFAGSDTFILRCDDSISDSGMTEVLRYMYTGTTHPLDAELSVSLYQLAQVLELQKLQERCVDFLMCNVSVREFARIYNFAITSKIKPLREVVENYFARNKRDIMRVCYYADGVTMVKPSWMKPQEALILDVEMKRLIKINMSSKFFDYDQLN